MRLKEGYRQADKLDEPIFTPSTKAEQGLHDENISFEMRDFAMKNLDFRVKLKNLYDFIFSL